MVLRCFSERPSFLNLRSIAISPRTCTTLLSMCYHGSNSLIHLLSHTMHGCCRPYCSNCCSVVVKMHAALNLIKSFLILILLNVLCYWAFLKHCTGTNILTKNVIAEFRNLQTFFMSIYWLLHVIINVQFLFFSSMHVVYFILFCD